MATQPGETDGFDVGQHVGALQRHVGRGLFPLVLVNDRLLADPEAPLWEPVALSDAGNDGSYRVIAEDLVDPKAPWRHESTKLAKEIMALYHNQRTGRTGRGEQD